MARQRNFSRSTVKTPKLSRKAFIWLAEILGSGIRDNESVLKLAERLADKELGSTCRSFCPETFKEAVRQFSS